MVPQLELIYRSVELSSDIMLGEARLKVAQRHLHHALKWGGVGMVIWVGFPFLVGVSQPPYLDATLFIGPVVFLTFFGGVIVARIWHKRHLLRKLERNRLDLEKVRAALATEVSCQVSRSG